MFVLRNILRNLVLRNISYGKSFLRNIILLNVILRRIAYCTLYYVISCSATSYNILLKRKILRSISYGRIPYGTQYYGTTSQETFRNVILRNTILWRNIILRISSYVAVFHGPSYGPSSNITPLYVTLWKFI